MEKMQEIISLLNKQVVQGEGNFREFLDQVEINVFLYALTKTGGCVSDAARMLKMKRSTLEMRLRTLRERNDHRFTSPRKKIRKTA